MFGGSLEQVARISLGDGVRVIKFENTISLNCHDYILGSLFGVCVVYKLRWP